MDDAEFRSRGRSWRHLPILLHHMDDLLGRLIAQALNGGHVALADFGQIAAAELHEDGFRLLRRLAQRRIVLIEGLQFGRRR